MKLTGQVLERLIESNVLMEISKNKDLPIGVRFKLAVYFKKLEEAVNTYLEQKQLIVEEFCETDENGKMKQEFSEDGRQITKIPPENIEQFNEEMKVLMAQEIEIEGKKPKVKEKDFPVGSLSPADIMVLTEVIEINE